MPGADRSQSPSGGAEISSRRASRQAIRAAMVPSLTKVSRFLMTRIMGFHMAEKSNKRSGVEKMSSAITANDRARGMVIALAGQRSWSDTREAWLARVARITGLSARRIRAIFYQEPIRLSADEYISIQSRFARLDIDIETADALVAQAAGMARVAPSGTGELACAAGEVARPAIDGRAPESRPAHRPERASAVSAVR
jgi:hypothetical protein